MQIDINTKVKKHWSWKKFRFIEKRSYEVVKYKKKQEWANPTYGNGGGDFIWIERKTVLKVFEDYLDALDYVYYIKKVYNGKI